MSSKAKTIARRLLRQNRGTRSIPARSWRVIAREDYGNKIPAGTLCRFAINKGEWIPRDEELQIILGLKKAHAARTDRDMRPLFDRPVNVLLWQLMYREAI